MFALPWHVPYLLTISVAALMLFSFPFIVLYFSPIDFHFPFMPCLYVLLRFFVFMSFHFPYLSFHFLSVSFYILFVPFKSVNCIHRLSCRHIFLSFHFFPAIWYSFHVLAFSLYCPSISLEFSSLLCVISCNIFHLRRKSFCAKTCAISIHCSFVSFFSLTHNLLVLCFIFHSVFGLWCQDRMGFQTSRWVSPSSCWRIQRKLSMAGMLKPAD